MQSELMQSEAACIRFRLDPRTKLLLLLMVNFAIFGDRTVFIMATMSAIPIALLLFSGKVRASFVCALTYTASAIANIYLVPATHGILNIFTVMVAGMFYRLMPALIMGYYLVATTTVSEFIASMERMHISKKIVIPFSVMFRFFPTVREESRAISDAMRMRGIRFGSDGFKKPMAMLEYRLVPLLMCSVKIGDELSAASLTRGLGNPVKRTNICRIGFGTFDLALTTVGIAAFAVYLV